MGLKSLARSGTVRSVVAGLAGFLAYGGWAFYVNVAYGTALGIRSGLVQGSYSFVLTFVSTSLMELQLKVFRSTAFAGQLTIGLTILLQFVVAYGINWLAGTPEIAMTILPGFIIGSGYTIVYVVAIRRATRSSV